MKNILVALNLEHNFQKLIDKSVELAEKFNSKIWLIHIADPDPDFVGYEVGPQYIRDSKAEEFKATHAKLQSITETVKKNTGLEAESLLVQGPTVETILEEAKKLNTDLIVIGHESHSFLYKAFVGETSIAVTKDADIPILLVPLQD